MTAPLRVPIPRPRLESVKNLTPFPHLAYQKMGPGRRFFDVLVVKGTFLLAPDVLAVADEQASIACADEPWDGGDPARSSLRVAGDAVLAKPGTDILVTGTARSTSGRALTGWDCAVVVGGRRGTLLRHSLQITGPRSWVHRALRGWTLTAPEPAVSVPVRYELAYGGAYPDPDSPPGDPRFIVHRPNPSGTGFFHEGSLDRSRAYPGPQWQLHEHPVTAMNRDVPLAGLGPVGRAWSSRKRYAGTYDLAWEQKTMEEAARGLVPDYPRDFDLRFFQCAHPALWTPEPLAGDEHIGLSGLLGAPDDVVLRLPGIAVSARLLSSSGWLEQKATLDTVHLDLDASRVHLSFRFTLDPARNVRAALIQLQGDLHG